MTIKKEGNATLVSQEAVSLEKFILNLDSVYPEIKEDNLIINLFVFEMLTPEELSQFIPMSNLHKKSRKSFVLVTPDVDFDAVPDSLNVVPTVQEAHDLIVMDEIERDLDG